MIDNCYISSASRERAYAFPLCLEADSGSEPVANLSAGFRAFLDERYGHHHTPEEILGYVYAILHAPTYRVRYNEFFSELTSRLPFPEASVDFETLSELGWELPQAHLLREAPRKGLAQYFGQGDHLVETMRYVPQDGAVWINETQCFKPVPKNLWDFRIGDYRVLDKYLKSRRRRNLSLDNINHFSAIADSLAFTIEQMAKIDEAYQATFPDQG